jgi:hypothetical protein
VATACLTSPVILILSSGENLKLMLLPAASGISSPVCKLRPILGLHVLGENVPKPLISKGFPAFIASFTTSKNCSMTILALSLDIPHDIAVSLIKLLLVIGIDRIYKIKFTQEIFSSQNKLKDQHT